MAKKEIKQKIVLEGEREYNQAIKEAQRNLKTLTSEMKAETAELKKNATEQQKAEAKAKSLKQQIAEQEKIVKTLKAALQEVREKYGDNADEVAKWEQKLNNARATLANMKNDLDDVGKGFQGINTDAAAATVATKSVADALGNIGSTGESVSGAIEDIFTSLIDHVTDAAQALWDMIAETAARANNWTDLASYFGSSAQELQMWDKSIEAAGGDFQSFIGIVNQLAYGGKTKNITEMLGISKENYQNDIEYTLAVMDELEKRKNRLEQGDFDSLLEGIFGRKSKEYNWFLANAHGHQGEYGWINGWRDNPERFNGDVSNYGLTGEELGTMNDLYVKIQEIEQKWGDIKEQFAAGFGKVSLNLLVNVEGTLDGIADYLNATDDAGKQAALDKIRANVEEFFTKLADVIRECIGILRDVGTELQGSDDPVVGAIGGILTALADSLQWIVDNQETVKHAFEAIFSLWLVAKLAAVVGQLSSILMQIEAIKTFKGISAAKDVAAAGASAGGSWATAFWAAAKKAVPVLAFFAVLGENAFTPQGNDDLWDEEGNPTELGRELGITRTQAEAGDEWSNSEEGQNSIWGGKGDRIEEAGVVTRGQYASLNSLYRAYTGQEKSAHSQEELYDMARAKFENDTELFDQFVRRIEELGKSGKELPADLPLEWFGVGAEAQEEYEDLDEPERYTDADRDLAVQDWFDAMKDWWSGNIDDDEYGSALDYFNKVFGERQGDVMEAILQKLEQQEDQTKLDDIPMDWWMSLGGWNSGSTGGDDNGVTSADLEGFRGLPANLQTAAQKGVAAGVKGLRVEIDGQAAGRILAPYVSQEIARSIV